MENRFGNRVNKKSPEDQSTGKMIFKFSTRTSTRLGAKEEITKNIQLTGETRRERFRRGAAAAITASRFIVPQEKIPTQPDNSYI